MTVEDAARLIAGAEWPEAGPQRWADLGCGDGTFTLALASQLPPGSIVHAMDVDTAALRAIPRSSGEVAIATCAGDFTALPWPFPAPDGVLLANALHYVADQAGFVRRAAAAMSRPRFVVVEYDTDEPNPWIPYPVSRRTLTRLGNEAGLESVRILGARPSVYRRRAPIYAAELFSEPPSASRRRSRT
jgi:ubiquinone/menaquinone biosynthesis C-methylase UbiE